MPPRPPASSMAGGGGSPRSSRPSSFPTTRRRTPCVRGRDVTPLLLALDQGTSSTRCIAFDRGAARARAGRQRVACSFPAAGLVEQDPDELVASARAAMAGALDAAGSRRATSPGSRSRTRPRRSCSGSGRAGGRSIPAIVWQDRRSADSLRAAPRRATSRWCGGAPGSSSTRPSRRARSAGCSITSPVPRAPRRRASSPTATSRRGSCTRLGGGRPHVTDAATPAARCSARSGAPSWDAELLDLFGVPAALLPPIVDSDAGFGTTAATGCRSWPCWATSRRRCSASVFGAGRGQGDARHRRVPLGAGRRRAAGAAARRAGELRLAPRGRTATRSRASCRSPARRSTGSWRSGCSQPRPSSTSSSRGAPPTTRRRRRARAAGTRDAGLARRHARHLAGLSRATTRAEIVRATVDGVLHQVADGVEAIARGSPSSRSGSTAASPAAPGSRSGWPTCAACRSSAPAVRGDGCRRRAGRRARRRALGAEARAAARDPDLRAEPELSDALRRRARARFAEVVELAGRFAPLDPAG